MSRAKEPQHIYADLPFGGVHTSSGTNITLRFPGQWFQSEAGLHQNWMRDYDPTLGRYIQADPLGLVDGASVYNYALQKRLFRICLLLHKVEQTLHQNEGSFGEQVMTSPSGLAWMYPRQADFHR